jgi:hypothetical protein
MSRIVGKILLFIILGCATSVLQATVTLRTVDLKGKPLTQATVGVPFNIELVIEREDGQVEQRTIQGLEAFTVTGRSSKVYFINNQRSSNTSLTVVAHKTGTYTIGPAELVIEGKLKKALPITIMVSSTPSVTQEAQTTPVFIRMSINKTAAVVGEKIQCTIRVYYLHDATQIQTLTEPTADELRSDNRRGPTMSKQKINGVIYHCAQWEWDMYPTAAGTLSIPAVCGDFRIPDDDDETDMFSQFFRMMGQQLHHKRVYSNALTLTVDALPPYHKPVEAIGEFSAFAAQIKPSVAHEGEGMMLTLTVEGKGALDTLRPPQLTGVPSTIKWYESKNTITPLADGKYIKSFEYIVQGLKEGEWQLPAQEFTYFDVVGKKYVTIHSMPLTITITPALKKTVPVLSSTQAVSSSESNEQVEHDEVAPLQSVQVWQAQAVWHIPWWLYCVLMLIPGAILIVTYLQKKWRTDRFSCAAPAQRKKQAFAKAMSALRSARKNTKTDLIYPIFTHLFATIYNDSSQALSHDALQEHFKSAGISSEHLEQWHHFIARCAQEAYTPQNRVRDDATQLFNRAEQWLIFLQGKL